MPKPIPLPSNDPMVQLSSLPIPGHTNRREFPSADGTYPSEHLQAEAIARGEKKSRQQAKLPWEQPAPTGEFSGQDALSSNDQGQSIGSATGANFSGTLPEFWEKQNAQVIEGRRRLPKPAKKIAEAKTVEVLDPRPAKPKRDFILPTNGPRVVRINEWRDRLLPGSFRGIPFEVETYSMTVGRRTAVYEYPQRDLPSAQDFGLVTKDVSFSAFVLGDDYDLQRNNLIQALEFPGPGELIHPYYGRIQVNVTTPCRVSETATEYRMAKFELNFVAVSDVGTAPLVYTNTMAAVSLAVDRANEQAKLRLSTAATQAVLANAPAYLQFVSDMPETILKYYGVVRTGWDKDLRALFSVVNAVNGFVDIGKSDLQQLFGDVESLKMLLAWLKEGGPFADLFTDPAQSATNYAVDEWVDCAVLSTCTDLLLSSDWDSYEELYRNAGEVVDAIHTLEGVTDSPEMYDSFVALRLSIMQMVWSLGRLLPRERTLEFVGFTPAVVLSYGLYETPLRDEEIVRRNTTVNPLFVRSPALVLSS